MKINDSLKNYRYRVLTKSSADADKPARRVWRPVKVTKHSTPFSVLSRHPRFGGEIGRIGGVAKFEVPKAPRSEAPRGVGSGERGIRTAPIMRGFRVT